MTDSPLSMFGYYADISFSASKTKKYIHKLFGKKCFIGGIQVAADLMLLHRSFQRKARRIGIPIVSSRISTIKVKDPYVYTEKQICMEQNLHDFILNCRSPREMVAMLIQYFSMYQKSWSNDFIISIDPVIGNFGIDRQGTLRYFDFFPPRQILAKGSMFLWPKPSAEAEQFLKDRHFTAYQSMVIYTQLMRVLLANPIINREKILSLVETYLGEHALSYIQMSKAEALRLLLRPERTDADRLRILAIDFCYQKIISYDELKEVFMYTHISNENVLPHLRDLEKASRLMTQKTHSVLLYKDI